MSVPMATARLPMSVICLATSSRRSTVRAASTRSAPASAHRRASVVPRAGPTPLITTTLLSSNPAICLSHHPVGNLLLAQRDPGAPILIGDLVGFVIRQRGGHLVDVDDLDGRAVGLGQLTRHPLPPELQEALAVVERLHPVGHPWVLIGNDDTYLAVRIRLRLSGIQRGLVV